MRRVLTALVACLLPLTSGVAATAGVGHGRTAHLRWEHHHPLPDRHVTPGRAAAGATPRKFCHAGYTTRVRDVSTSTRRQVFAEYGIRYSRHRHFEVDHLVPLELGGSNSIKNLWPEPGRIPNAKDGLENRLHDLVCERKLGMRAARHAVARDWVKARARYGHTAYVYDRPGSGGSGGGGGGGGGGGHACTTTSSGSCIRAGEFCPAADYGKHGYDASGRRLVCRGSRSHPHWEHH